MKMNKLLKSGLAAVMALAMTACGSKPAASASGTAFKIGGSGPLTGSAAVYGTDVYNSAKLAVKEINEAAGKTVLELRFEDDEADPEKSPNAYGVLKDWGMQASIYTTTSGAGLAVAPDYAKDHIFALTPSGTNTGVVYSEKENYPNAFQVCFTDPNQGTASADYIAEHKLGTKIAIIYRSDDDYSTSIYNTFAAEAAKVGLDVVSVTSFIENDADYSTQLLDAQNAGAEIVFLPIYYTPAASILTQADSMGFAPLFFGVDGMDGVLNVEGFNKNLAEGVYLLTPFAADATDEKTVHFVTAFNAEYDYTPTQFGADAYDAVYAIYQGLQKSGAEPSMSASEICDKLIEQFTSMEFEGVTGVCTWAENGEVSKSPKAVIIKDGAYTAAE